nr:NADH dehydrogenase subunit 4 [Sebastapistes coniorta]
MMKILGPVLLMFPAIWMLPVKWLWPVSIWHSFIIAVSTSVWVLKNAGGTWGSLGYVFGIESFSVPLIVLSCWLMPATMIANHPAVRHQPPAYQRMFLTSLLSILLFLLLAFSATELMMFYIMFEATLIPTLVVITRWGNQAERLNAGVYFLFYTLAGSLPLLVALMLLHKTAGSLSLLALQYGPPLHLASYGDKIWWMGCLFAFLVKMPLYGTHLWLPKAHVEAPIAGSMLLAAVLLKLGGYGMVRIMIVLEPLTKQLSYIFITIALWGVVMTASTCLRQTDLKSMIAYSSVSHMGLVIAGILTQTPWGLTGALVLMIAHGLTSSALFCLANMNYERLHSRTLLLARGLQLTLPLMATWWFLASLANLALPPLPNLMGELMITVSLFNWSKWTLLPVGAGVLITASYSLYMFLTTQRGPLPSHIITLDPSHTREHLILALHFFPLLMIILKPGLIWGWIA